MRNFSFNTYANRGQSLIELLVAMSIAVIAISTIVYLLLQTQISARQGTEYHRGETLAAEGLTAVKSIAQHSFDDIRTGVYGLAYYDDRWHLESEADVTGKYTRTITIGAYDDDVYQVQSAVSWPLTYVRTNTVTYDTIVTNWRQTRGEAADFFVDIRNRSYSGDGTTLDSMTISNTHATSAVTLTDIVGSWSGGQKIEAITIDGVSEFSAATSSEKKASDETVPITDVVIAAGSTKTFGPLVFDADMRSTDVLLRFVLSDGSIRYVRISP